MVSIRTMVSISQLTVSSVWCARWTGSAGSLAVIATCGSSQLSVKFKYNCFSTFFQNSDSFFLRLFYHINPKAGIVREVNPRTLHFVY
jgi:hypothetical protein